MKTTNKPIQGMSKTQRQIMIIIGVIMKALDNSKNANYRQAMQK
jgi:hypothetical protein